jgi:hypothetical protein
LEHEANRAGLVGVETESVNAVDKLRDVAWENRDEEQCRRDSDPRCESGENNECDPQQDFDNPGRDDDEVGV